MRQIYKSGLYVLGEVFNSVFQFAILYFLLLNDFNSITDFSIILCLFFPNLYLSKFEHPFCVLLNLLFFLFIFLLTC